MFNPLAHSPPADRLMFFLRKDVHAFSENQMRVFSCDRTTAIVRFEFPPEKIIKVPDEKDAGGRKDFYPWKHR